MVSPRGYTSQPWQAAKHRPGAMPGWPCSGMKLVGPACFLGFSVPAHPWLALKTDWFSLSADILGTWGPPSYKTGMESGYSVQV